MAELPEIKKTDRFYIALEFDGEDDICEWSVYATTTGLGVDLRADGHAQTIPHAIINANEALEELERKEDERGRDRQAEEDRGDSEAGAGDTAAGRVTQAGANAGLIQTYFGLPQYTFTWNPAPYSLYGVSGMLTTPEAPRVETVQSDMPIMATRWAHLAFTDKGVKLRSATSANTFDVDADAECKPGLMLTGIMGRTPPEDHTAPHVDCTCGFYAVPADKLPKHDSYGGLKLLVELSGRVVEHEEGYRAEHQRVLEAQLPPCQVCGDGVQRLMLDPRVTKTSGLAISLTFGPPESSIRWMDCGRHEHNFINCIVFTPDDLARHLGVPVTTEGR